jgi:hypothetical protein
MVSRDGQHGSKVDDLNQKETVDFSFVKDSTR